MRSYFADTDSIYTIEVDCDDSESVVLATMNIVCGDGHLGYPTAAEFGGYAAVGPRVEMTSSWCSNVLSVLKASGITGVARIERYRKMDSSAPSKIDELTECVLTELTTPPPPQQLSDGVVDDIAAYNQQAGLGFDEQDLAFYQQLFHAEGRNPTVAELHDLSNSNSEHSRHHLFRGRFVLPTNGTVIKESLMDLIRRPLALGNTNSISAMCDNASAIRGWDGRWFMPENVIGPSRMQPVTRLEHITFTAETHNFPTGIAPFQGATTGVGGRIRDTQAIGRGGYFVAGTAGYCVGHIPQLLRSGQRFTPTELLLLASDGASDYGNKIGEPLIQGFTRSYGDSVVEWLKPVMFSGGIGRVPAASALKDAQCTLGLHIVRVGGPTYRLGIGGGAASSHTATSNNNLLSAVQRGDAQMQNRMDRWLRACLALPTNPIVSIHDQGAGGMANVTKEIVADGGIPSGVTKSLGALVRLSHVDVADQTLSAAEIWVAESQEQNTVLLRADDMALAAAIAEREGVPLRSVGILNDTGRIRVVDDRGGDNVIVVDLPLNALTPPRKTHSLKVIAHSHSHSHSHQPQPQSITDLRATLCSIDVCSKRFLTTKVDRSVGGLIAQQQCVGPHNTPVADVAVVAHDFFGFRGAATAIGEQPIVMLTSSIERGVRKAVAEMCTNLVWAPITAFTDIKCSVNWMWPASSDEGKATLLQAVKVMSDVMCQLGIAIDGGKDSVSMSTALNSPLVISVDSPPQVVVSGYAACTDIRQTVTPGFKRSGDCVWLIKCGLLQLPHIFECVQALIRKGWIVAGHDVSDGGLLTTLAEMCFASEHNNGVRCNSNNGVWCGADNRVYGSSEQSLFDSYEAEASLADAAMVIETNAAVASTLDVSSAFHCWSIEFLGVVTDTPTLSYGGNEILVSQLRDAWESTATELEMRQTRNGVAIQEHQYLCGSNAAAPSYQLPQECQSRLTAMAVSSIRPRVAVIRGEGSNGDREMTAGLWMAGFEVHDVTTSDLTSGRMPSLDAFRVAVFVGGFTYSDVLGAAAGWGTVLTHNQQAHATLDAFRRRTDTLMLGVCNGCQLLTRLGWVGENSTNAFAMQQNQSGRFESRFVTVGISGDDVWFRGMDGARLGVWVAHGEGQFPADLEGVRVTNVRVAMRYVDAHGEPTTQYPLNPSGSAGGVAGVTSADGRVLALMPHPERCIKRWQLPWMPPCIRELDTPEDYTPWMLLFRNALEWCL